MELSLAIKHIYPNLTDEDFVVMNNNQGDGDYIIWYNTEIQQPTKSELETAWAELQAIETKEQAIQNAYNKFNNKLKVIKDKYTQEERETFELKRKEAEKVLAGEESLFINTLCIDGETPLELATKIQENSNTFQLLYAQAEKQLREDLKQFNN